MPLVSGLYRMAPSATSYDRDESIRRVRVRLRRIVGVIGPDAAALRIRKWPARDEDERARVEWLALEAETVRVGGRAGTV